MNFIYYKGYHIMAALLPSNHLGWRDLLSLYHIKREVKQKQIWNANVAQTVMKI